jgi:hypothetical protein
MLTVTKESQEIERKRRLAWEQEQEAKYAQRQAEMERQMLEMRQEILSLKASVGMNPNMTAGDRGQLTTTSYQPSGYGMPMVVQQPTPQTSQAQSPVSTSSQSHFQPAFVEGSSNRPAQQHSTSSNVPSISPELLVMEPTSPHFIAVEGSQLHPDAPCPQKRSTPNADTDGDDESSDSESDESPPHRARRRTNGHDTRCLTIQVRFTFAVHMLLIMTSQQII